MASFGKGNQDLVKPRFQITSSITYSEAIGQVKQSFQRMSRTRTVKGLFAEVRAFANYMIALERRSPIVVEWHYEDVKAMDTSSLPQLEKMKKGIVKEMLMAADAAKPAYYTANPVGRPFQRRVRAAQPLLDKYMWIASRTSRKNAKTFYMRGGKL